MQQTVLISNRGQLTLPAAMRKRFGLQCGGAVILEEHNNELVIKPAAVKSTLASRNTRFIAIRPVF